MHLFLWVLHMPIHVFVVKTKRAFFVSVVKFSDNLIPLQDYLLSNNHALGVLYLSIDYEAVEVHAGLQFAAPDD